MGDAPILFSKLNLFSGGLSRSPIHDGSKARMKMRAMSG